MSGCAAKSPASAGRIPRPLLFRAEGRERQDRGGDSGNLPTPGCGSSRRRGWKSSRPASSRLIRARRNIKIVIEAIEPAGIGALMALMEERKKKLAAEGLFDEARKQLLPWLPEVIGVVTSPTGAVIRDILHRLQHRFPRRVLVWPGQGTGRRLRRAGRRRHPRLQRATRRRQNSAAGSIDRPRARRLVGRPLSFNEEIVVRRRGKHDPADLGGRHETDITLIDFAADKRAPTPTAAAKCGTGAQRIGWSKSQASPAVLWCAGCAPGKPPQRIARGGAGTTRRQRVAGDPAPAAGQRGARYPRIESQYQRAPSALLAGQRRIDAAGAARTGRAGEASA